jgi:tetratricopeptide (TPR) repeat protein
MLKFYGWQGTQQDIAAVIKPSQEDRNVNVDELLHYVWNYVTWLNARYRVGGNLDTLRAYLAEGLPVIIEEGMPMEQGYWPGDDRWAGHYLLLTGYDDAAGTFTAQDSFYGPDRTVLYADLDANWRAFNRVYMLVYPPEREPTVQALLGPDVEFAVNRQRALQTAQDEVDADDQDVFAWFNLGSNLVFFERYGEAADAFDRVRQLGAPQRMWRYQFSPFLAYFHTDRIDDLVALAEYALQVTPESEEAMLWRGWGLYRQRRVEEAAVEFQAALDMNPGYEDAKYALRFLGLMP